MSDVKFNYQPTPVGNMSPNAVAGFNDFYVSFYRYDIADYGDSTTAIVLGQGQFFMILNGDHRLGLASVVQGGFQACLSYFLAHIDQANMRSDHSLTLKDLLKVSRSMFGSAADMTENAAAVVKAFPLLSNEAVTH